MAASDTTALTLRGRLRCATAQAHRALEATMDIEARCRRPDAYRDMIARLWGLYTPLEAALTGVDWPDAETLVRQRAKSGWLADDLAFLGLAPDDIAVLPKARALPAIDTVADVLGVLYVLEGATLGGQVILPALESRLGVTERAGGRFFASYGRQVGRKWRAFLATLERFGGDPGTADQIESAALGGFESFQCWMDEAALASEGPDDDG